MHTAAEENRGLIVKLLLLKGANPNMSDKVNVILITITCTCILTIGWEDATTCCC